MIITYVDVFRRR